MVFTPTALDSKAQGRRAAAHPGSWAIHANETPTGFYKFTMPAYRSFVHHQHGDERRAICVTPLGLTNADAYRGPGYAVLPRTLGLGM